MSHPTDRNLLVGILALQMDFVSRDQLLVAMNAWILQKDKPLEQILLDNKALASETMTLLRALVAMHIERHGNNPKQSLQSLSSIGELRQELQSLADADVQATLSHVSRPSRSADATVDHEATQLDAICDQFVRAWRDRQQPKIEDYWRQAPATAQDELLEELLGEEIRLRRAAGDAVRPEDYQSRFPQHHQFVARAFAANRSSHLGATIEFRGSGGRGDSSSPSRFRVIRPHAKGGLGEVFVARDTELNREVALKEIQERYAANPDSRSRFLLEAEVTGGLEHPGIVPVYGLGQYADGRPFYAMRFIKGDSLNEAIERFHNSHCSAKDFTTGEVGVEFRQLLGRFIDVCQAIEYAHSRGVLHRDLKPGNIMLGKYGETLVVDWGLAKVVGRPEQHKSSGETTIVPEAGSGSAPTQMGSAIGTPAFMSPEQAGGRIDELDQTTDVYSLGATLFYLLTAQSPIGAHPNSSNRTPAAPPKLSIEEILRQIQRGEFPAPRTVVPKTPKPLEAICLKAMSLRPSDRYPTVAALALDVERYLADEPVSTYREPLTVRARRWVIRHQTSVSSAASAVVIASCMLVVLLILVGRKNQQLLTANSEIFQQNSIIETHLTRVDKLNTVLLSMFQDANPDGSEDGKPLRIVLGERLSKVATELEGFELGDPLKAAELQTKVGESLLSLGYPKPAVRLFEKACSKVSSQTPSNGQLKGHLQSALASAYRDLGDFDKSCQLYESMFSDAQAQFGSDHAITITCQNNLAVSYRDLGRYEEAARLLEEAAAWCETQFGRNDVNTCLVRANVAEIYLDLSRAEDALTILRDVHDACVANFGPEAPCTLFVYRNLVVAHVDLGQLEEVIRTGEERLSIHRAQFGQKHPDTLLYGAYLAVAYFATGRTEEAAVLMDDFVTGYPLRLGEESQRLAAWYARLGRALLQCQQDSIAERLLRVSLDVRDKKERDLWTTFDTKSQLGHALLLQGRFGPAEPLLLEGFEGLQIRRNSIPKSIAKTRLGDAARHLKSCYEGTGDLAKAKKWGEVADGYLVE